jgi:hypothetical protein
MGRAAAAPLNPQDIETSARVQKVMTAPRRSRDETIAELSKRPLITVTQVLRPFGDARGPRVGRRARTVSPVGGIGRRIRPERITKTTTTRAYRPTHKTRPSPQNAMRREWRVCARPTMRPNGDAQHDSALQDPISDVGRTDKPPAFPQRMRRS